MAASALALQAHTPETQMSQIKRNDSELYLWAMGWILKELREEAGITLDAFGDVLGLSGPGYKNLEKGESPNLRRWMAAFEHLDKDIVTTMAMARVIVRTLQSEELLSGKLSNEEKEELAELAYYGTPKL